MEDQQNGVPNFLEKPIEQLLSPLSKEVGTTLGDLWYLIFGKMGLFTNKQRMKHTKALEEFAKSIDYKVSGITPEKKIEPELNIVGPALEASKFCIEDATLREMFATLLSKACHADYANKIHPSFSEIIKNLAPLDAHNFKIIAERLKVPVVELSRKIPSGKGYNLIIWPLFIDNVTEEDFILQSSSLFQLSKQGLITFTTSEYFTDDKKYTSFENNKMYVHFKNLLKDEFVVQKGVCVVTPMGRRFMEVCF